MDKQEYAEWLLNRLNREHLTDTRNVEFVIKALDEYVASVRITLSKVPHNFLASRRNLWDDRNTTRTRA